LSVIRSLVIATPKWPVLLGHSQGRCQVALGERAPVRTGSTGAACNDKAAWIGAEGERFVRAKQPTLPTTNVGHVGFPTVILTGDASRFCPPRVAPTAACRGIRARLARPLRLASHGSAPANVFCRIARRLQ
jgi:hypothetical protein